MATTETRIARIARIARIQRTTRFHSRFIWLSFVQISEIRVKRRLFLEQLIAFAVLMTDHVNDYSAGKNQHIILT